MLFSSICECSDAFGEEEHDNDITYTASEGNSVDSSSSMEGIEDMDISCTDDCSRIEIQHGPETRDAWRKRLTTKLKAKFDEINSIGKQSEYIRIIFIRTG